MNHSQFRTLLQKIAAKREELQIMPQQLADLGHVIDRDFPAPAWVSVADRLPEKDQNCLVWTGSAVMTALYLENDKWWLDYYDHTRTVTGDWFTHWMPLPNPPEEDADETL